MNNYLILVPLAMTFLFILFTSNQFSSHNNPLSSIMYCQQQYTMKCDRLFRTLCPGRLDIVDNNIVGFTEHCSGLSDILCPTIWSRCVTLDTWEGVVQNDISPKSSLMLCEFTSRFYFSNKVFR